ncbi:MAG TPA: hypothetical protein VFV02_00355 [Acidimicrobiales bacterium]|nr:hypothetical protein [Acidimicrobiales bacterium]
MAADLLVRASAPVRICDNGGWTDTWFGGPGRVLNLAVSPRVEVVVRDAAAEVPAPSNPLVLAALEEYPPMRSVEVHIRSDAPAGSGLGTSAAVSVALVAAFSRLGGEHLDPMKLARAAHYLEADLVGVECGVQDHVSAAFGGINFITIDAYPSFTVEPLAPWPELDGLLTVVYLGQPHDSSGVHEEVIDNGDTGVFERLRLAALDAKTAVAGRDLIEFGRSLVSNTTAQADLHPGVVGRDALVVIEAARRLGALGWKVNGAGGDGGSVTVLSADPDSRRRFDDWVHRYRRYRVLPVAASSEGARIEQIR